MRCLKCGEETRDNQVFCEKCLIVMTGYPVKIDAKVHIPKRSNSAASKKPSSRKKAPSPEEQIALMHKLIRRLMVALLAVSLLFVLCVAALIHNRKKADTVPTTIGRNYIVETDTGP